MGYGINDISLDSFLRSPGDAAFEKIWIPLKEAQLLTNPCQESKTFFVDDLFGTG